MRLPEMPDVYIEKSPLFRMHTMKTPTLIMFGTRDTSVPTEQGWEHFRAMQQAGKIPLCRRLLLSHDINISRGNLFNYRRHIDAQVDLCTRCSRNSVYWMFR
jgi:hypothetical protein